MNQSVLDLLKLQNKIPIGMYCYDNNGLCPFWKLNKDFPEQQNGFCYYLSVGDWYDEGFSFMLWDQLKECGINNE